MPASRIRPLRARPGARFHCAGGGMCCSDIHALGPLTIGEARRLRKHRHDSVVDGAARGASALAFASDGACVFLDRGLCQLHAGMPAKPTACRRFPYGLIATPDGGRVTTVHRCPCRTLGERRELDLEEAARSLADPVGRMVITFRIENRVSLTDRTSISFASYRAAEEEAMTRLMAGESPAAVFDLPEALPTVDGLPYASIGRTYLGSRVGSDGFDAALAWVGHAICRIAGEDPGAAPARPWGRYFDDAERTTTVVRPAGEVIGDWAADALWDLSWAARWSLDAACTDLWVRWAAAGALASWWIAGGSRPDRAAAEAVLVAETVGAMPLWHQAVNRMSRKRPRLPGRVERRGLAG
ncbi:MAG: YkgJ family cysteine cluster protein [Polyangiaceae bacterium]